MVSLALSCTGAWLELHVLFSTKLSSSGTTVAYPQNAVSKQFLFAMILFVDARRRRNWKREIGSILLPVCLRVGAYLFYGMSRNQLVILLTCQISHHNTASEICSTPSS